MFIYKTIQLKHGAVSWSVYSFLTLQNTCGHVKLFHLHQVAGSAGRFMYSANRKSTCIWRVFGPYVSRYPNMGGCSFTWVKEAASTDKHG